MGAPRLTRFRFARLIVARFVTKNILRSAIILGLFIGFMIAVTAVGYVKAYPDLKSRVEIAHVMTSNPAFSILYGKPHALETVTGYTVWRTLDGVVIISGIWAMSFATRIFRGQEEDGRWELLLTGQTTARRATAGALGAMGLGWLITFAIGALTVVSIGHSKLGAATSASLYFSLVLTLGIAEFLAIGALVSQFAPTRRKAATTVGFIFGLSFLLRGLGDSVNGYNWLNYISPLGWIHLTQPYSGSHAIWLLPIVGLIATCVLLSIYLAGRRDLGTSLLADHDTAKPHIRFLGSPLAANFRLTRGTLLAWLIGIIAYSGLIASIAKSASSIIGQSKGAGKAIDKFVGSSQSAATQLFLGMAFYIGTLALLMMATSMVNAMRSDESKGYLDNFLVRRISRIQWLGGRMIIAGGAVAAVALGVALVCISIDSTQHLGVGTGKLWEAAVNMLPATIFLVGLGICTLGIKPRLTSFVMYGTIAWAFLLEIFGSAVKLNHWVRDTSILQHVAIAPAVSPHWTSNAVLTAVGIALAAIGSVAFTKRDLEAE